MNRPGAKSLALVLLIFASLVFFRITSYNGPIIIWDVFGYYLYLPATIIHGDPLLNDASWIEEAWQKYDESSTMFYLSTGPKPGTNYFFLMGMASMALPWFLIGHLAAWLTGAPMDGFSDPYQWSMAIGCCIYSLVGLLFLRKILLHYFSDRLSALLIAAIALGTNYYYFNSVSNLETGNILFVLFTIVIWNAIRWYDEGVPNYLYRCALACGMMVLCKPSEAFCVLIPLLWGVGSWQGLWQRFVFIKNNAASYAKGALLGLSVMIPQMTYWFIRTGSPIYDSYKNPGVGLDLLSPHTLDAFFSFKKGWLLYNPIMWLALFGFWHLYKYRRELFWPVLLFFGVSTWIITSWSEWWYGASYSIRPMLSTYPVLVIPMGLLLRAWWQKGTPLKALAIALPLAMITLNLFQTWQFHQYILHPYTVTKDYYFAVFGKTTTTAEDRKLLSWERTFEPEPSFNDEEDYNCRSIRGQDSDPGDIPDRLSVSQNTLMHEHGSIGNGILWGKARSFEYDSITSQSHVWLKASMEVFIPVDFDNRAIQYTITMSHKGEYYGYSSLAIDHLKKGQWNKVERTYLTPSTRKRSDIIQVYIWAEDGSKVYYDDLRIEVCERKDGR